MAKSLSIRLREQAGARCGYCRTSMAVTGDALTIEHLIPVARGGTSDEANLWLSCRRCNETKGTQVEAVDPVSGERVLLFNPRRQTWHEHFRWSGDGTLIMGLTPVGRATATALNMNRSDIVSARGLWVSVGWHPPED
jgi:hypothetical protein